MSEQLSKGLKRLFNRTSRRASSSRSRRVNSASANSSTKLKSKTAEPAPVSPQAAHSSTDKAAAPRQKVVKSRSFWSNLLWVRPWLLVVALWLTFVLMIAIALAGLSNPGREMVLEPVTGSIAGQPLSAPDAAAFSRLSPADKEIVLTQRDPAATLPEETKKNMPAWPLLLMVVACAGGCMMLSHQGILVDGPRRRRAAPANLSLSHRPVVRSVRPTSKRHRRRKHRRLSPQQPDSQVMAFRSGQKIRHTSPQQRQSTTKPVSFALSNDISATASPTVSVVPENETSHLDWKEGSLAHKLDVRQTRSIRSFL
ncbi:MAG: hypothetical protein AAGA83_02230 [Cyanobacteria bacterium P01_F01_bin.116]